MLATQTESQLIPKKLRTTVENHSNTLQGLDTILCTYYQFQTGMIVSNYIEQARLVPGPHQLTNSESVKSQVSPVYVCIN